ncbi:hypothetical protein ONZ45_g14266 [Pleurotus djamor]|nr:hypothetical protein ONZ45_g14266 [Pleurotus djamor]
MSTISCQELFCLFPNHTFFFNATGTPSLIEARSTKRALPLKVVEEFKRISHKDVTQDDILAFKEGPAGGGPRVQPLQEADEMYAPFVKGDTVVDATVLDGSVPPGDSEDGDVVRTPHSSSGDVKGRGTTSRSASSANLWQSMPPIGEGDLASLKSEDVASLKDMDSVSRAVSRVDSRDASASPCLGRGKKPLQSETSPLSGKRQRSISPLPPVRLHHKKPCVPRTRAARSSIDRVSFSSAPISSVCDRKAPRRMEDRISDLEKKFEEWKSRDAASNTDLHEKRAEPGSGNNQLGFAGEGGRRYDELRDNCMSESGLWGDDADGSMGNCGEASACSWPSLALWVLRESVVLSTLRGLLSEATIPELPGEPVSMDQESYIMMLSWIDSQREGLEDWIAGQLPDFTGAPMGKQEERERQEQRERALRRRQRDSRIADLKEKSQKADGIAAALHKELNALVGGEMASPRRRATMPATRRSISKQ